LGFISALDSQLSPVFAQGTAFSYDGRLQDSGGPANGTYNFTFSLYTNSSIGSPVAGPVTTNGVAVTNGLFTVQIDFGAGVWNGRTNWLEIAVETNTGNSFTTLSPRQQVTPTPYAIFATTSGNLSGTLPLAQLPAAVVTNGASVSALAVTNLSVSNLIVAGANEIAPLTVSPSVPIAAIGSISTGSQPSSLAVAGRYAYVINQSDGTMQIVDVSNPANPVNVSTLTGLYFPDSIVVAGRYAYVSGGRLQIIDVSNPANPVMLGSSSSSGGFVAVSGGYAYVTGGLNMQVVDVSNPSNPVTVGSVVTGASAYCITVAGRYAYIGYQPDLQIFDVSNPTNPTVVSTVNAHAPDPVSIAISGRYAYVGCEATTQIFDVSNPASPVQVGQVGNGGTFVNCVAVAGRFAYAVSTGININILQVIDVSNPASPISIGAVGTDNLPISLVVSGRYAYVLNNGSGTLQVFDLGGAYIQPLEAGTIEVGTLQTRDTATVGNNLAVRGGLTVGGSAHISGGLSVNDITGGVTTNLVVTVPTGTKTLSFTNGVLRAVQ
jgi:hypothetical protein